MPNNVTFDSSSSSLKPAGANTQSGVAMALKEYPKTAVNVVGYTDATRCRTRYSVMTARSIRSWRTTLKSRSSCRLSA
nr:Inner membrane lipoprotein YiaD precursor [Candidatus Pantoea persica]